jgi:diguanylate cyclase (GGDEF)-like protein
VASAKPPESVLTNNGPYRLLPHSMASLLGAVLLLLPVMAAALAPERAFHHYVKDVWSIEEGLPQITVNAVVQGPEGYIWAATQAGLARFDGVRFTTFDPSNTPEIPGIFLQALHVDSADRLWIGSYRGAAVYESGQFRAVDGGFGREIDVFDFAETGDGRFYAATAEGLLHLTDDLLLRDGGDPGSPLWSVFHHDGLTVAGGRGEIFHHAGDDWQRLALGDGLAAARVVDFAWHDGTLWAATSRGLLYFDDGGWQRFQVPGKPLELVIEMLYQDRDGNFWVGANDRLIRLRGREVIEVIDDEAAYAHPAVLSMTEDHEGNLWVGSRWNGLARLWNGWVLRYDKPEGLHNSLVWTVDADERGDLWVGTMDGLAIFRDGRFEQVTRGHDQPHPHAYTLLPEADRVWVGTRAGLYWWNRDEQRIEQPGAFDPLEGVQVNGVVRYGDDYWLATNDGVWRWNGQAMERMAERGEPGGQDVRLLHITPQGQLLAGARVGLLRLEEDEFQVIDGVAEGEDVTAVINLADGRLVIGTLDETLWVEMDDGWHRFGTEHGLPANSAFAIAEHDGVLWVAGIRGIYELSVDAIDDYISGRIGQLPGRMVLNERGDVPGAQKGYCCNGAGNARGFLGDGEFWLPTRGGLVRLIPEHIIRNEHPPGIRIDRVRYGGQWHALATGDDLDLSPGQRDLAFGFSVLSFQDPGSVQLEYRLAGFDRQWHRLDEPMQRQAIYTNLPAGDLRLEVRATNNAGVWSTEPESFAFTIPPRLWETTTFQAMMLFLVLVLIWIGFNWRLRSLQKQQKMLEQTVAERTDELRVANEHLRDYSSRMETVSMTDPLTGSWNRRYLLRQLPADLAHFHRELARDTGDSGVMLFALLDIDYFKRVNDRHGHGNGDAVLRQVADRMRDFVRRGDYVIRWGGEEFLIVFRPMPLTEVAGVAKRLLAVFREKGFEIDSGEQIDLTCSVGLSTYPAFLDQPGALSWEDTVALADKALYHVKHEGRDGWCLITPTAWAEPATLLRRLDEPVRDLVDDKQVTLRRDSD